MEISGALRNRGPERQKWAGRLEVEDDAGGSLEIVLGLVEEAGVNPVGFAAQRKPGIYTEVQANARLSGKRVAAVARRLGLQVRTAYQSVAPRLEPVAAAANAGPDSTASERRRT